MARTGSSARRALHGPSLAALLLAAGLGSRAWSGTGHVLVPPQPGERTEHFLLRLPAGPDPQAEPEGLAFAEWRRRRADGGWQLELDLAFPDDDIRVYAVECLTERGPRLVWREVSPGAGRTLLAEWTEGGAKLRILEWGTDGSLRESFETGRGAVLPLYFVELARLERMSGGSQLVLDPLARALERVTVRTSYAPDPVGQGFLRAVELRREDGSLAGRYTFRGDELVDFRWQAGGWRAERCAAGEHARLLEQREVRRAGAGPLAHTPGSAVKDL